MEVDNDNSLVIVLKSAIFINWVLCGQIDGVVILFEKGEYSFFSLKNTGVSIFYIIQAS